MKKHIKYFLVLFVLVFALTACTNNNPATATPEVTGPETTGAEVTKGETTPTTDPGNKVTDTVTPSAIPTETAKITDDMDDIPSVELIKNFTVGWNLGNTLDATGGIKLSSETSWGNPKTTQKLIDAVIEGGFNVIRIPVTWDKHHGVAPNYEIDEKWMARVKEVVDYAYSRGAYVILNTHHEDWITTKEEDYENNSIRLCALWRQIAIAFRDYDEHLIFEGMNEPRNIGSSQEWNGGTAKERVVVDKLNTDFYNTVRATGGNNTIRSLVFTTYGGNPSENACKAVTLPDDPYIIMNVHSYAPYNFALNIKGTATWSEKNSSDTRDIKWLASNLKKLYVDKGIAVIVDEFGNVDKNNEEVRAANNKYYLETMKNAGIPCVIWDNGFLKSDGKGEAFGLIDRNTCEWVYPKILEAIQEVFAK